MWGIVGFAAASALAGAAGSGGLLILARTLQGVAGAFMTTNSLALLRATYGAEAGRAVGLWTALTGVAMIAGPPVGGALVEWASWRWVFFINLPIAAVALVLARAGRCRETAQANVGHLDVGAASAVAAGLGLLTFGLVQGPESGFGQLWWAFAGAAIAFAIFVAVELRVREPMLPFWLFRRRNFLVANLSTLLVYAGLGGFFLFFNLYLQFLGFSPFEAGLFNLPTSVVMIVLAARFGALADRYGPRAFLTFGPLVMATGMLVLLAFDERSELPTVGVLGIGLFSLGLAALVAPITSTALAAAPTELAGIAAGVNQTLSRTGNLLAVAVLGIVVSLVFGARVDEVGAVPLAVDQVEPLLRDASIDAYRAAVIGAVAFVVAGAAVAAVGISNADARREAAGPSIGRDEQAAVAATGRVCP